MAGRRSASAVQVNTVRGEARLNGEMPPRVALGSSSGSVAAGDRRLVDGSRERHGDQDGEVARRRQNVREARRAADPRRSRRSRLAVACARPYRPRPCHLAGSSRPRGGAGRRAAEPAVTSPAPRTTVWRWRRTRASTTRPAAVAGAGARGDERRVLLLQDGAGGWRPDGTLFAAWRHVYPGSFRDMAFATSRDGGRSFSAPVRVSEDGWAIDACPDDGPAMAVDASGTVHLAWPTVLGGDNPRGRDLLCVDTRRAAFHATAASRNARRPEAFAPANRRRRPAPGVRRVGRARGRRQTAALREVRVDASGAATFGSIVTLSSGESGVYPASRRIRQPRAGGLGDGRGSLQDSGPRHRHAVDRVWSCTAARPSRLAATFP